MGKSKSIYDENDKIGEKHIAETFNHEVDQPQNVMVNGKYTVVDGNEVKEDEAKEDKIIQKNFDYSNKKDFEWLKEGFNINDNELEFDYFDEISYRKNLKWIDSMTKLVVSDITSAFSNFEWLCKYLKGCNLPQPALCNYKQYHMMATIMLPNETMTLQAIPETRDIVDKKDGLAKKELFRYRWEISTNCQFHLTHVTDDNTLIKLYNMWDVKFMVVFTLSKLLKSDIFKTIQKEAFNGQFIN